MKTDPELFSLVVSCGQAAKALLATMLLQSPRQLQDAALQSVVRHQLVNLLPSLRELAESLVKPDPLARKGVKR